MTKVILESRLETLETMPIPPGGHAKREAAKAAIRKQLAEL